MLYKKHSVNELDDDLIADMYFKIIENLNNLNFSQYEISNFSKQGYESKHNIKYWTKEEYIGIGMGATSYYNHKRITNSFKINPYLHSYDFFEENLTILDEKKETMMLGLRMTKGVSKAEYYKKFKCYPKNDFNYLKFIDDGLLEEDLEYIKLTKKGIFLGNIVFEEFV